MSFSFDEVAYCIPLVARQICVLGIIIMLLNTCMDLYEQFLVIHLTHLDLKTPINSHIAAYDQAHDTPDSACKVSH